MKRSFLLPVIVFSIGLIAAAWVLGNNFKNRNQSKEVIYVKGLGETNFESDLIVWGGSFSESSSTLEEAYNLLNKKKEVLRAYLAQKGVKAEEIVFPAVSTRKNTRAIYDNGTYVGEKFIGYTLDQEFKIESKNVNKIEGISRKITELLNEGVQLNSYSPRYYYTKLSDLKVDLIAKATKDAKLRAETIVQNAGDNLGELKKAEMGVFQITGQNSDEDYSWGGTFNTTDKKKTASITIKLTYKID